MATIHDPKHVVRLTLQPVGRGIEPHKRVHLGRFSRCLDAHLEQPVLAERTKVVERLQMVNHIGTRNTREHLKTKLVAQYLCRLHQPFARHIDAYDTAVHTLLGYCSAECRVKLTEALEERS